MKTFFGFLLGGLVGFAFPYLLALTNLLPSFNHSTNYEKILSYMLGGLPVGAVIGVVMAKRKK